MLALHLLLCCYCFYLACAFRGVPFWAVTRTQDMDTHATAQFRPSWSSERTHRTSLNALFAQGEQQTVPDDAYLQKLNEQNYVISRDLIMGVLAYMFRNDVAVKVLRRHFPQHRSWDSAFANITQFKHPEAKYPLGDKQYEQLRAKVSKLNDDPAMHGVTVEDIVRIIERSKLPVLLPPKDLDEKLHFIEHTCLSFPFRDEDGADKELLVSMCTAVRTAAENPTRKKRANRVQ